MKTLIQFAAILICISVNAQDGPLKRSSPGDNRKAMVGEQIYITKVEINYDRPGVKGREGKIYGTPIVHTGYADMSDFGTAKKAPWRAGANENTTIEFSTDVKIEGKDLPAGKYGFFVMYGADECSIIFSKDNASWGNYFYDEKNDVLRVKVKPVKLEKSVEWLKYEFVDQTENSAVIALQWEKVMIPFKVEVDIIKTMLDDYRTELKSAHGFDPKAWAQAADFCLKHKTNMEEGNEWASKAMLFQKDFGTMSTKAQFLTLKGETKRADSLMTEAMKVGSVGEVHQYGRQLLSQKKNMQALDVFTLNAKNHPKEFTTYFGLARGYSAVGDHKKALVNAKAALALAPNELNKQSVEGMIKKIEEQKDVN